MSPTIQPVAKQASLSSSRNSTIDLIRTIACFGVVIIHVHSNTAAAENLGLFFLNFCVPFFFATALTYFVNGLSPTVDIQATITKIIKRIGIPFLTWSFIYSALLFVKSTVSGKPYSIDIVRVFLYGESAEHMYYLPELLAMQLLVLGIYLLANRTKLLTGISLVIIPIAYLAWGQWHQYFGTTPTKCVITYLAASFLIAPLIKSKTKQLPLLLLGVTLFALPLLVAWFGITNNTFLNDYLFSLPLSGIGLLLIALNISSISIPSWTKSITSATYGIYLSHVMFLEAFEFIFEKTHQTIIYDLISKLAVALFIFIACIVFILIVRKISFLRPIVLGEN
jgi:surface polysaccharide O-acyltransferase-like enzyme